jgi:hypothetical protein
MVQEAWARVPQDWINKLVDGSPQRLKNVIESGGQMANMR